MSDDTMKTTANILLLMGMAFDAWERFNRLMALYNKARAEGRDVTDDELAAIGAEGDAIRANAAAERERQRAETASGSSV